ncbi:hypothetical protein ACS0TY_014969 [Phlomoides rotata]
MNGEGSAENTLEFGGKYFGESAREEEEEERGAENGTGNKRIKEMPIDRFGELPDSLLIHTLSFLTVKEAAITSVLSKRWEFLWAQLPSLEFRADSGAIEKVRNFVSWVNRTLAIRTVRSLENLDVSFFYHKCFSSDVDAWVHFAAKNKVKKLNLHLHCYDDFYMPPQAMYSCPSLTKLHVRGCIMDFKTTIEWRSLTYLHLHIVHLDQHLIDEILSTCPVLYTLYIEKCHGFDRMEINSPSLHSLSIAHFEYNDSPPLKISAPYIHKLEISLPMVGRKLQVENTSSLVRADIDYQGFTWHTSFVEVMNGASELLESVQHVKELHVGLEFIKVVAMMALIDWQFPQSRRELLIVAFDSEYEHSISGIISLLESSPNLQTLVIDRCSADGIQEYLLLCHLPFLVLLPLPSQLRPLCHEGENISLEFCLQLRLRHQ